MRSLARRAISNTAEADPDYAESLVHRYLESGLRSQALRGLDLLGSAALPGNSITAVDAWARRSLDDREIFNDAVDLLGEQKSAAAARILLELHGLTQGRPESQERVLDAMARHGGESFRGVAECHLVAPESSKRILALQILARGTSAECVQPVLDRLIHDTSSRVRYAALVFLRDRGSWAPPEEAALKAAAGDPDRRIVEFATSLLSAEDRKKVPNCLFGSSWDWPDTGEE